MYHCDIFLYMFFRLLLLFVLVPVVELALLIRLGELVGFWPTLGLIVTTGVLGSALAKQQGFSVLRRLRSRLNSGQMPGVEMLDGVIILVAGALLLTPGVLTDIVGFIGLFPLTRGPLRRWLISRFKRSKSVSGFRVFWGGGSFDQNAGASSEGGQVEDGSYEVVDKDNKKPNSE